MSDTLQQPADTSAEDAGGPPLVTAHDFASTDFDAVLASTTSPDSWTISAAFRQAQTAAQEKGLDHEARVFGLLDAITGIHLNPEDRAQPWGPMASMGTHRSAIPSDFKGEQSAIIADVLDRAGNPVLRARLADVVWTNDRSQGKAAAIAVAAYAEAARCILDGRLKSEIGDDGFPLLKASKPVHRGLQVAYATNKRGNLPKNIRDALHALYTQARDGTQFTAFVRAAELGLYYELLDPKIVAAEAESVASAAIEDKYALAVNGVWDLGARLYDRIEESEGKRRCQIGAVNQLLQMRKEVKGSPGAEASWVMDALQALQHISGMEALEEELNEDLRRLQKASLRQMVSIPFEMDVSEEQAAVAQAFAEMDLPTALKDFALLRTSLPVEGLKAEARESLRNAPLSNIFGSVHLDDEGKPISRAPAPGFNGEPSEEWYRQAINQSESIRRHYDVAAKVEPARLGIMQRFDLTEAHFAAIVARCPFVPPSQGPVMALGFARYFQADFMSATHLLIPQLEPCLRHILKLNGHDPAKRFSDATEEDMDLGNLLERLRSELETILTEPVVAEIDGLFHARPGPALRHELAHGQLSAGACFHPNVRYACWLIYRLCCLFVIAQWDELIAPDLLAQGW